jgi:hypothetical protein
MSHKGRKLKQIGTGITNGSKNGFVGIKVFSVRIVRYIRNISE